MRQVQAVFRRFHATLQPIPNVAIVDVHELRTDTAAVSGLQFVQNDVERAARNVFENAAIKRTSQVLLAQPMASRRQFRAGVFEQPKRVQGRDQVTTDAIFANQLVHAILDPSQPQGLVDILIAGGAWAL